MTLSMMRRLDRLAQAHEDRKMPAPGLVVVPTEDGFSALGKTYPSVEAAQAAYPDRTGQLIVIRVVDASKPPEAA